MTRLRYRAYISYSHQDERWAAWLHRALESYRVPRKLVGQTTKAGPVPSRIRPVFRDRDDLSSSTDLSSTVKQTLADSENLVVLCSPAAAASHWVGEEIRQFACLGRADRIFCIIVAGSPAADGSVAACFSSALADIGLAEPLAADVRKWADGKRVAKLKLIAGLLGIQLDELRQRDVQRRRKRQVISGLAVITVLTLAIMTVLARISELHEREKAEQLATFVVDLGERLQSDTDLETLAIISTESYRHLQGLDPNKLSPETGKKVALALRQMGRVSQGQGRPEEALEAYRLSRDMLENLHNKYHMRPGLLFELGNAEYYIGNLQHEQGRHESAVKSMQRYFDLTRTLLAMDPENPDWLMEMAYSLNNLAALQLGSGKGIDTTTLEHVTEATRLMERVLALRPDDKAVADNYATILAWAADAQRQACNLEKVMQLKILVRDLSESATRADPANNDLQRRYAYALTGVARAQILTGDLVLAEQNLEHAIALLQQLSIADPGNILNREQTLYRKVMLARLLGDTGKLDASKAMLMNLAIEFTSAGYDKDPGGVRQGEYFDFLLTYADVESRLGKLTSAKRYLQTVIQAQLNHPKIQPGDIFSTHRQVQASYQWWLLNGTKDSQHLSMLTVVTPPSAGAYQSCTEADTVARLAVIENDRDRAVREVAYLQSRGYADPGFVRFCKQHDLCPDQP